MNKPVDDFKLNPDGTYRYVIIDSVYYDDIEDAGEQLPVDEPDD